MDASHTAVLDDYAQAIASLYSKSIPRFDPRDGGVEARLLVLMESPSRRGHERGFVSVDNPTPTGKRMREEMAAVGIRREDRVIWNVVPWYLGDERKARNPTLAERRTGALLLPSLLELLPKLEVVLTLGGPAREGWRTLSLDVPHVAAPHPSNTNLCARPWALEEFRDALRQVAERLD